MKFTFPEEKFNQILNDYYKQLSVSVVLLIFVLGLFIFWLPQYNKLKNTGILERQQTQEILQSRESYLQQVKYMKNAYDKIDSNIINTVDNILPQDQDVYLLYTKMEQLAKDNGLTLLSVNINDSAAADTTAAANMIVPTDTIEILDAQPTAATSTSFSSGSIKEVAINISVSGIDSYEKYKKFLVSLENNPLILNLDAITYVASSGNYTFTLKTHFFSSK